MTEIAKLSSHVFIASQFTMRASLSSHILALDSEHIVQLGGIVVSAQGLS
jgi:hypothetical protein